MGKKYAVGVDIGGSHISCKAIDIQTNTILSDTYSHRFVDSQASAELILSAWAEALKECIHYFEKEELAGIGFAMPGPFDYKTGVASFVGVPKFNSLNGFNIKDEMHKRLNIQDDCPIKFLNDATCFAMGEAWLGAGKGFSKTMALTFGTGFGSAFLIDGIPVDKGEGVAPDGCVWHLPYHGDIADASFSTRWFSGEYLKRTGKEIDGVKELVELAENEAVVKQIFVDFGKNLGEFISPWIKGFQTECLILGGNIARSKHLFEHELLQNLEGSNCSVKIAELFEDAAIVGSARLVDNDFYSKINLSSNK